MSCIYKGGRTRIEETHTKGEITTNVIANQLFTFQCSSSQSEVVKYPLNVAKMSTMAAKKTSKL